MEKAKLLVATSRGPPGECRQFFSRTVEPFLDENVRRGRRQGLVVYEAMLYTMHFDFSSAIQRRLFMGEAEEWKVARLQAVLSSSELMLGEQLAVTLGSGKPPLIAPGMGFEDYVMRVNLFRKGAIASVVEPQDARASFLHAEAEALRESLAEAGDWDGRIEGMVRLIRLVAECQALRTRLLAAKLSSALESDPSLAVVLPTSSGWGGLAEALGARSFELRHASDGSFKDFLGQASSALASGGLDEAGLRKHARLQLRYDDFIASHAGALGWKEASLQAALHAVDDPGPD
jgi:hypothetical protein